MPTRNISYRLGTTGKAEVKNDFAEIAQAGEAQAKRLTETFEAQAAAAERAADKAARTAAKIAAIAPQTAVQMQIASSSGTNLNYQSAGALRGDFEGSAKRSAAAFRELLAEQEKMEARGQAIRAMLDPLGAAQERYNRALAEARTLAGAKILTDEQLIQEEARLKAALDAETAAFGRNGQSLGQRRAGMQQLSFQLSDIAQGFALGTAPQIIFAQQAGQTAQAVQLLSGDAGKFATFMTGPWGMAVSAGVVILATMIPMLFKERDAVRAATDELEKQSQASEAAGKAAVIFARTQEGVHDALIKAEDARKKATDGLLSHAEASNIAAKNNLTLIDSNLRSAQSYLTLRRAQLENSPGMGAGGTMSALHTQSYLQEEVGRLEKSIVDQQGERTRWQAELEASRADLAEEAAKRSADPVARLNRQFNAEVAAAKAAALANHEVTASLTAQIAAIEKRRQVAIKAAEDAAREDRKKPQFGREIAEGNRADLLAAAQRYSGLSEHSARGKSVLEDLFHQANFNIDPEMVKWCAAFVNAVLATQGVKGTGSLAAKSFLGFGQATTKPTAGDIVVSSSHGQDHVGFFEGFDAKGNVRLFSGNSSDKVGSSTINRNNVLGFRRAPDAAQEYKAEADAAKDAAEKLKDLVAAFQSIEDQADPTAAAARKIAADLAKIRDAQGDLLNGGTGVSASRGALAGLGLAHPDFAKPDTSGIAAGAKRLDDTIAQWTTEDQVHWQGVEDAATKAGQAVIDNFEEMKRAGESFVDDVLNPQNWTSFGDFGRMVLRDLAQEAEKLAILNPLKAWLFGDSNGGSGGGALKSILSGLGKIFGTAPGAGGGGGLGHEFGHNAAGTENWSGGMTWIAENGPELINLPAGTRISSAPQTRRMLAANDRGSDVHQHFHLEGAVLTSELFAEVDRRAARAIQIAAPAIAQQGAAVAFDVDQRRYGRRG